MFQKIDHLNMSVRDLTESDGWYQDIFGFNIVESGVSSRGLKYQILQNNDFALCQYEFLKLIPAHKDEHEKYQRIYHYGFRISDPEPWKEKIQQFKLHIHYGPIAYPRSTSWYVYDPSGHEIEVCYAPGELF